MYQSLFYCKGEKQYYLRDDRHAAFKVVNHWPTLYEAHPDGEFQTLEGISVNPVEQMDNWKNPKYYEKDVDRETRFLVDYYYESDDIPKSHNIIFLDIECEIAGALNYFTIKNPRGKITSIALYDNNNKKYYCLVLDEANKMTEIDDDKKHIIPYSTERELLSGFLDVWIALDPTIVSGWNSAFFDMPYLYQRIKNICGEEFALMLSPIKKIQYSDNEYSEDPLTIGGINHIDYMLLFKKFIVKQEPSYRLGDIGTKYVKLGKIDYVGSLDKLFKDDIDKFIEYNIRDVEIIVELEKSLKFVELTITICHLCHTTYQQIYYSTMLNEGAILTYLKRKGIISPNKPTTYNNSLRDISVAKAKYAYEVGTKNKDGKIEKISKEEYDNIILLAEYAGGYLKDPVPGLYEWIIDLDFTSLYPSIIRSLNMGIETLVGRIVNRDKYDNKWSLKELREMDPNQVVLVEKLKRNRTISESRIKVGDLVSIIEENDLIISAPGVIFRKDKSSVVCDILTDWFVKRQEYKTLMKKAYKVDNNPVLGEFYDRRQHAYKILLNALYGCYAINGWRYTDGHKIISKAITLTGQRLLQESIKNMNEYLSKELGDETPVDRIITSDTDSLFIHIKDLLIHRFLNLDLNNREEVVPKTLEIANELQIMANKFISEFVADAFNLKNEPHYFELKQEVVLDRGYFAGKRRYAQHIVNKEGVPTDELDVKGLDLMKSNFPPLFKKFGENIINEIMFGTPKTDIDKKILDFRTSLRTIDWKNILKPTGLKQMEGYLAAPPRPGEIFSKLGNKCPINTKSAIYTNDLLKFKNLDKKYPIFKEGDKIFIVYLKENPYKIEVMALNGYDDAPEIEEIAKKYINRDGVFDSVMKNKLESLYCDLGWGDVILNPNVHKFFSFD